MSLFTAGADAAVIEPHRVVVERVEVTLSRLPRELDGLRIAQLSDFHYGSSYDGEVIQAAVRAANELNPDLTVLTGDYVTLTNCGSTGFIAARAKPCARMLGELKAPLGTFAVLGNHDYGDPRIVTRSLEAQGITVLRNSRVPVKRAGARLWLAGIEDVIEGEPRLDQALWAIPSGEATVLLAHEPDCADTVACFPVDLQLSGHSHGGQVRLPLVGCPYLPVLGRKYPRGMRRLNSLSLYTNRGLGTTYLPVRFNCPPEVTLITLRSGATSNFKAGGKGLARSLNVSKA